MTQNHCSLQIIIVGAGISGLAAATCLAQGGYEVLVLEAGSQLSEIGAGIQVPPNAMRVLESWGLRDIIYNEATRSEGIIFKRYSNGRIVGGFQNPQRLYQYDNVTIHRADYQRILYDAARSAGAEIRFSSKVKIIEPSTPSITLEDGSILTPDLIVGADGIGSKIRTSLLPNSLPQPSPDCAYRMTLTRTQMLSEPKIAPLIEKPSNTMWLGPGSHIAAYPMRGLELFNVVVCRPGTAPVGVWNESVSVSELKEEYRVYENAVKRIFDKAGTCHKWQISQVPDLHTWRSENGKVVLLGDAAHAMMPYTAQGATQGIEDAAVLGGCLARCKNKEDIPSMTRAYEDIRKPRAERIKATASGNMKLLGLHDGPEQKERDRMFGARLLAANATPEKKMDRAKPDGNAKFGSPEFEMWLYGHDVQEAQRQYFEARGSKI